MEASTGGSVETRMKRPRSADAGDPGELVRGWLAGVDLPAAVIAQRAGVSVSTLHRVLHNAVDPSLGTLREIAFACGHSLVLDTRAVADPAAAASVRAELEPGYVAGQPSAGVWRERLRRQVGAGDRVALLEAAGRASAPLLRPGTVLLRGSVTVGRLASAGHASESSWALSGVAGFVLPGVWEPAPAPTILWTQDPRRVLQLLADARLERTSGPRRVDVAICEGEPALFANSVERNHVRYAAPIQVILDGFSIGHEAASHALTEAMSL